VRNWRATLSWFCALVDTGASPQPGGRFHPYTAAGWDSAPLLIDGARDNRNATLAAPADAAHLSKSHIQYCRRPVTADLALRLGRRFRQSPQYWLNLQARYDLDRALDEMGRSALSAIEPVAA
jgi:addiction module HigA family antidote